MSTPPLKAAEFQILLVLSDEALHGYGIMQALARLGDDAVRLETGPLYRHLHHLLDDGLLTQARRSSGDDPRRRTYRLTALGRKALAAETDRLARLVSYARAGLPDFRPA